MDNTQGLGQAMELSAQRDRAKSQEQRIQDLENRLVAMEGQVHRLTMLAGHHINLIAELRSGGVRFVHGDSAKFHTEKP